MDRNNIKTDVDFIPKVRIADLQNFAVYTDQESFDVKIEQGYKDNECFEYDHTKSKVVVWGYKEDNPVLILEKQYNKLDEVYAIISDLPEFHPVTMAIWNMMDNYNTRFIK